MPRFGLLHITISIMLAASAAEITSAETCYQLEEQAIVSHNSPRFQNRPMYCANLPAALVAGDRPLLRYAHTPYVMGTAMLAVARGDRAVWLHDFDQRVGRYRPGHMSWTLQDAGFEGLSIRLEAVTLAKGAGFALKMHVEGAHRGDRLIWTFGGAQPAGGRLTLWAVDVETHPAMLNQSFNPADCENNECIVMDDIFVLTPPVNPDPNDPSAWVTAGTCTLATRSRIADADAWADPQKLLHSSGRQRPIYCAVGNLSILPTDIHWLIRSNNEAPEDLGNWLKDPAGQFERGLARIDRITGQIDLDTPDERFDFLAPTLCYAIESTWYPPVYVHGAMSWNIPFPGWRTLYGPTAYGWHENVRREGHYYIDAQTRESDLTEFKADPNLGLTQQAHNSRFYGKGRINRDQHMYNFQEVFFDQMIHQWRWTGDAELEKILLPALELHLEYNRECFDPDGNGVYESYINVWASDSVWYNGAETAQSTAYAYTGYRAAAEMARRAGEAEKAAAYQKRAKQINTAMHESLWMPDKGYLAESREAVNLRRVRDDPCLYTIFLPIDAGMMDPFESAGMLYFTEWGLERTARTAGGEMCWQSNWVPYIWSVRELAIVESAHLALAYYQTGLGDEAWKLVEGCFADSILNSRVPGGIQLYDGGTDFNGPTSMLARVMIEGLFGYRPDRPDNVIHIRPQLPSQWDRASVRTPDFALEYVDQDNTIACTLELADPAPVELALPVRARGIKTFTCNGQPVEWRCEPGFEKSWIVADLPAEKHARVELVMSELLPPTRLETFKARPMELINDSSLGKILEVRDPDGALDEISAKENGLNATITGNVGHHLVFKRLQVGELEQWERIKIVINDPQADAERRSHLVESVPEDARWETIDLNEAFNGDVREIYKQQYLSPRPDTCSAQIGTDGFSPWTCYHWKMGAPEIKLNLVEGLLKEGRLITPQKVPFARPTGDKNIAFTSLWDNWPDSLDFDVHKKAEAVWLLVAGSSNCMQTGLANGVIRLHYADGQSDEIELVHPDNYWSLEANYDYDRHGFCLPKNPPPSVILGEHCRAMLYNYRLKKEATLARIEIETLSPEVVIGLMGATLMNPASEQE